MTPSTYKDKEAPEQEGNDYPPERIAHDAHTAIRDMMDECPLSPAHYQILEAAARVAGDYKHTNG